MKEKIKLIPLGIAVREVEFSDDDSEEYLQYRYEYMFDEDEKDQRRKYKGMFPWNRNRRRGLI